METLFDWTKPNAWNSLSYYNERYSELELFTYINEFELLMGSLIEKSINIYLQLPKIITVMKTITKEIVKKIEVNWMYLKSSLDEFGDTS